MLNRADVTEFAPVERVEQKDIVERVAMVEQMPIVGQLADLIPDCFMILNRQRQIIYCNQAFMDMIGSDERSKVYGLRFGEAIGCLNAVAAPGGCGTSERCAYCGAINSVLESQKNAGQLTVAECNIMCDNNIAQNLRVWAQILPWEGDDYTVFIARDISDSQRRSMLEHIFFHDILNTIGGLKGIVELLERADEEKFDELIDFVYSASDTLIEEIKAQKDILEAESGDLQVSKVVVNSQTVLREVYKIYLKHEVARDKHLAIAPAGAEKAFVYSDPRLIKRIIGNMVKNALEASSLEETVTMGVKSDAGEVEFWVHNQDEMPEAVKMQVFKRSFSSKGHGRGWGTYSIKLLGENYLHGKVSFISDSSGTTFSFSLPLAN